MGCTEMRRAVLLLIGAAWALAGAALAVPPGSGPPPAQSYVQNYAIPGVTNYASIANGGNNYANWRKCRESVRTATSRCAILVIGDSTSAGLRLTAPQAPKAWPARTLTGLAAQPVPVPTTPSSWFGEGNTGTVGSPVNAAVTYGSGWTVKFVSNALGASWAENTTTTISGTTNALSFAFNQSNDTCDIWYPIGPGGAFTWSVDAGSASGSISESGASSLAKVTASLGSAGAHTLRINRVSGDTYISAVDCYNSASPAVAMWNGAVTSQNSSFFVNSAFGYNALPAIGILQPALIVVDIGINDWGGASGGTPQQTVQQYSTNLQTLITAAQSAGSDVVLVVPPNSNPVAAGGGTSYAVQAQYAVAVYAVARTNHLMVVDMQQHWGNYDQGNAAGIYADTTTHPGLIGHMDMGQWIAQVLAGL